MKMYPTKKILVAAAHLLFVAAVLIGPATAEAAVTVFSGATTANGDITTNIFVQPGYSYWGTNSFGMFLVSVPAGYVTGRRYTTGRLYGRTDVSIVDADGVLNHYINSDSQTFGIWNGGNSNDGWNTHNDPLSIARMCYLVDKSSSLTNGFAPATNSYGSPSNNTLIRWNQYGTSQWEKAHANVVGNSYIRTISCSTSALPANTLSASPASITSGQSSTISFDSGPGADAQRTICTPTNFSIPVVGLSSYSDRYVLCGSDSEGGPMFCIEDWAPIYTAQTIPSLVGSLTVSPTVTTTYTYNCTNGNGTTLRSATVTVAPVIPPAATVPTFTASPTTFVLGGSSTLSWTSTNATSCSSANFATGGLTSGSVSVSPTTSTTYSISCTGAGGTSPVKYATVTVTGTPDLSAGPVTPASAVMGTAVTLSSTIANNGNIVTPVAFTDRFQVANDAVGTGAATIGTYSNAAMAAGATVPATLSYTFTTPGTKYIQVCADSPNAVTEPNESNNCSAWTAINVTAADLVGTTGPVVSTPLNTAITLTGSVTNSGSLAAGAFPNIVQVCNTPDCLTINTNASLAGNSVGSLAVGATQTISASYTPTSMTPLMYRICSNTNSAFANVASESNYGNNCGAWVAFNVTAADLVGATGPAVSTAINTAVTLTGSVTNSGSLAAGTFPNVVQVCNTPDCLSLNTNASLAGNSVGSLAVGATQTISASYTPTSMTPLMYRICSNTNSAFANVASESNYGNNCGAWVAFSVTSSNLSAGSITPTSVNMGVAVTLSSTITNSGSASTGAVFTNVFQTATSAAGAGAAVIGTASNATLAASASGASTFSYTFPTVGTTYVRACADNNASMVGTITESNEADNCSAWTAVTVSGANLTAGSITPTSVNMGVAVTLSSTITNSGSASTGAVFTNVFQTATSAAGAGAAVIGTASNATLAASASGASTFSYTFPTVGTTYVRACADNNASMVGTITESNEADNCSAWTAVTVSGANLSAGSITPTSVNMGVAVTLSSTITNSGSASTGAVFTNVFQTATSAAGAGAAVIGTASNATLAASASGASTFSYTFPTVGTTYVRACADNNASMVGTITESNEADNCSAWTAVTVSGANLSAGSITPTSVNMGVAVTLSSTITNSGSASTGAVFTNVFQTATSAAGAGAAVIGTASNATLAASASGASTFSYTFPTVGTTYVRACADNNASMVGTITESNEADNCSAWTAINVTAADLVGTTGPVVSTAVNTAVTLTGTVTNSGSVAAGAFPNVVQVCNTPDCLSLNTNGSLAGNSVVSLAVGGTQAISASYTPTSGTQLMYRICTNVNSAFVNVATESNYGNNCGAWVAFNVTASNLTAGIITPTGATAGTAVNLASTISNTGNLTTSVGFTDVFQTATDAAGTGATDIGTFSNAAMASGATTVATLSYTFPIGGAWYVRACSDSTSVVTELNEGNNCGAWTAVNVTQPTTAPNLIAAATSPTTAISGIAVTMSSTLSNIGTLSTGAGFTNVFQFDADSNHSTVTSSQTSSSVTLVAGATSVTTVSKTFATGGTWYVRACADANALLTGTIVETNEVDNCSVWTAVNVSGATGANLVTGTVTPAFATAGTPVTMNANITNNGSASTGAGFTNLFQFDADTDHRAVTSSQTDASPTLGSGLTDTSTVSKTFSSAGTWYVRACADNNASFAGTITESDETDNCGAWTAVSVASAGASSNLTAGGPTPAIATAGTPVTISSLISNGGTGSTVFGFTNLFQFDNDSDHSTITSTQTDTSPAVSAPGTDTSTVSMNFPSSGTWYVRTCADSNASFVGVVTESNEADNCSTWTSVVVSGAVGINLTAGLTTPTIATAGTPVTMSSTINNTGSASTGAGFTNLFQFDNDSDHSTVTSSQTSSSVTLASGATSVTTVSKTFATGGTWYVRACTDNNASFVGTITESNEADNCGAWASVIVSGPIGAGVTSCTVDSASIPSGGSVIWTALPIGLGVYTWAPTEGGAPGGTGSTLPPRPYTGINAPFGMMVTAGGSTVNCPTILVGASPFGIAVPLITVTPARVVTGSASTITVSATGVDTSCTVTGPGVSQTILAVGGVISSTPIPIAVGVLTTQSTYTVSCDGAEVSAKTIVNVIPGIQEF